MTTEIDVKNNPTSSAPKKLKYECYVCKKDVVEETATGCGHVFCRACIEAAIVESGTCPKCNKNAVRGDLLRIYLDAHGTCDMDPEMRNEIIKVREKAMKKSKKRKSQGKRKRS